MRSELVDVIPVANTLGEGITWDPRFGLLWWTDIHECKLYRLHFETRSLELFELPEKLGSFGLTEDPRVFVGAFAAGFYLFEPETGKRTLIELTCADLPGIRMNDGRLDRQGRFWAGSMVEQADLAGDQKGSLYSVSKGVVRRHFGNIQIANGLAWNSKGDQMYFADSPRRAIEVFEFDAEHGTPSRPRLFARVDGDAGPDGATVDNEDHYWCAQWGASQVVRYRPDGQLDHVVPVAAPHVSCVEFGGPDLNHLFVTTAKWEMSDKALEDCDNAGHLFIYRTDTKGVASGGWYTLG